MYKVSDNYDFIEFPKNEPKCSERHNYFHLLVLDEFGYRIVDGEWYEKADQFHKIPKQFYTLECGIDVIENVIGFCERPTLDVQHINDDIFENSTTDEDVSKAGERLKTALDFFKKDKMESTKEILESLKSLHSKAVRENLWFYCAYQELWFSPKEINNEWKNGCFVWGPQNWHLRDPKEYIKSLEEQRKHLLTKIVAVEARIKNG